MATSAADVWRHIHAERARLVDLLQSLTDENWRTTSLCTEWTVEQVVAHLTAAASTGTGAWIRSMLVAGFNPSSHKNRRMVRYMGASPDDTLAMFRSSVEQTIAPTKDHSAWLGEVIVHSQDIARPLGITLTPDPGAVDEVARFFASKDFAVNSRRLLKGLTLVADDSPFRAGTGPAVEGPALNLVMAMAGRADYCAALTGAGVDELRKRLT